MRSNNILIGLFTGVLFVALFTPIITIYGFDKASSLILLYMLPLCGAATAIAIETMSYEKEDTLREPPAKKIGEVSPKPSPEKNPYSEFENTNVTLEKTSGEIYEGLFRYVNESAVVLDKAKRIGSEEYAILDHVFVNTTDIIKINKMPQVSSGFQESGS